MTFMDYFRDPLRRARHAPSRAVNRTRERRHQLNPELPRDGESFASYYARAGSMPELREAARPDATLRATEREARRQTGRIGDARRSIARFGLRNMIGLAAVEEWNRPTERLLDIPLGQRLGTSGVKSSEVQRDPGRPRAHSFTFEGGRLGLVMWGTDLRRSLGDVLADVETATGAPRGYLARLSGHESRNDPDATPGTSSASGFFQITDGTWERWAFDPMFQATYKLAVADRAELLDYRGDIRVDGAIAAEIARTSYDWLVQNGVERVTEKHLYMGHFGGLNGLMMARDQARGAFRHQFGYQYFTEAEIAANEPVFFEPKRDANGDPIFRTVVRNGRTVRIRIGDRNRPYTAEEVWRRQTAEFSDNPVLFSARASGLDGPLTQ